VLRELKIKILLDTNIIIHRETHKIVRDDIGVLFNWIDKLHYDKYIHPHTITEINNYEDPEILKSFNIKLGSYNLISALPKIHEKVNEVSKSCDKTQNDRIDSELLNVQYLGITDIFITEDRKLRHKANILGIGSNVLSIEEFLEKVTSENPELVEYNILAVQKKKFGDINLDDPFFNSFRSDYIGFDKWYRKKNEDDVYVCMSEGQVLAFLYLKCETKEEVYNDIEPTFDKQKRLKIGTFKVILNGFKLGERFLKIVFDNAIVQKVDEIYVTIFNNSIEQQRLIYLLEQYGFILYGIKKSESGNEKVYVRSLKKDRFIVNKPKHNFPYIKFDSRTLIVPIYEKYHTNLFPDSILRTESPSDFVENEPFRNAISKIYISRSTYKDLKMGDNIVFYRTGGIYKGVITTIGVIENCTTNIKSFDEFKKLCGKRSVFTEAELREYWDYYPTLKPFVVNFLYTYSFPKRINLARLIELNIIPDINSVPRGFQLITSEDFAKILKETKTNEGIIIY